MNNKYCKNCLRWYRDYTDQCNIPDCGISYKEKIDFNIAIGNINKYYDSDGLKFIEKNLKPPYTLCGSLTHKIYGKPSLLNKNNDCYFYLGLPKGFRWLTSLIWIFTNY